MARRRPTRIIQTSEGKKKNDIQAMLDYGRERKGDVIARGTARVETAKTLLSRKDVDDRRFSRDRGHVEEGAIFMERMSLARVRTLVKHASTALFPVPDKKLQRLRREH